MRQKVTWIIPGILVTLLLGLLWALPASAAVSGSVEFLDEKGGDEVFYVSLNGPAAGTGFWVQIKDSDLDTIVKRTGEKADELATARVSATTISPRDGEDWHDLQDMNTDGSVDNRDIKGIDFGADGERGGTDDVDITLSYDRSNGTLDAASATDASNIDVLEYWIKLETILGARAGTDQTQPVTVTTPGTAGTGINISDSELRTGFGSDRLAMVDGSAADWLDILSSNAPELMATEFESDVPANVEGAQTAAEKAADAIDEALSDFVRAYNVNNVVGDDTSTADVTETDHPGPNHGDESDPLTVTVDATDVTVDTETDLITGISEVTIENTVDDEDNVEVRVGQSPLIENDPDTGQDESEDINAAVMVKVDYVGNAAKVYPGGLIGDGDDANRVMVDSNAATSAISVRLSETGAATGIYGAEIMICDASDDPCGKLPSQEGENATDGGTGMVMLPVEAAGDTIRVSYRDGSPRGTRTATIALDPSGPSFSGFSPAHNTSGREDEPTIAFDVVDGESGITDDDDDLDSIYVVAGLYEIGGSEAADFVVYERDEIRVDEIENGFEVSVSLDEGGDAGDELDAGDRDEYELRWWAVAVDKAGNVGVSDRNSETKCDTLGVLDDEILLDMISATAGMEFEDAQDGDDNLISMLEAGIKKAIGEEGEDTYIPGEGCDSHVIRVDSANPELSSAKTGLYLDDGEEESGSLTSIGAIFSEPVDCDSVSVDDFTVDGAAPNAVACKGNTVYLSVDEMDSNDTPDVTVVEGGVMDSAGNPIGPDAEVESDDGIPAGLNVTVTGSGEGDRPITDKAIEITIGSDERLSGRPSVTITRVGDGYNLVDVGINEAEATSTGTANEWSLKRNLTDAGLYNVYVEATDRVDSGDSIAGLSGVVMKDGKPTGVTMLTEKDRKSGKAILFEVDTGVEPPKFTPAEDEETDDPNVFIRIDFASEGKEYGLAVTCTQAGEDNEDPDGEGKCAEGFKKSNLGDFTTAPGDVATDFDTSGLVEITSATFDGNDVTDDIISRDWVLFVYRPGSLTDGDHKLEIEVLDKAGNEDEFSVEFSKVPRKPYKLELNPGPNLISFPANPVDGDVNAVFGGAGNEDILSVVTFDNASGLWMTATRGEDGMFIGDLTTVDAMHGYWVVSDGVLDLSVTLAAGNVIATPPFISVQQGWNLVPVTDTEQSPAGTGIATNEYFANVDAEVVYGYDSLEGTLVRLSTTKLTPEELEAGEEQDVVETGSAYWVYANEAGIIIP